MTPATPSLLLFHVYVSCAKCKAIQHIEPWVRAADTIVAGKVLSHQYAGRVVTEVTLDPLRLVCHSEILIDFKAKLDAQPSWIDSTSSSNSDEGIYANLPLPLVTFNESVEVSKTIGLCRLVI